jgi:two-component system NarL family sensor kinase
LEITSRCYKRRVDRSTPAEDRASPSVAAAPTVAIVRCALVVAVAVGAIIDDRPGQYSGVFYVALTVAACVAAGTLAFPIRRRAGLYTLAGLDLILLTVLAHSSGGASSEVRFAFFALPVLATMLFRPRATLLTSVAVIAIYLTLALTQPQGGQDQQLVYVELVYLAWTALAAVLLSRVLTRRADTIAALARARGRLMADVLDAEDRERRRLAGWLHDGAVQNLLAAGQDLGEAEAGDPAALTRARAIIRDTIPELRSALVDLHPGLLTSQGLEPALRALAGAQAGRGSFTVDVSVDEAVDPVNDPLLLALARELLINVVKHANAHAVTVAVRREREGVALEVSDDGDGFDPARRAEAVADGHIGLASSAERVESQGGRLEIHSALGRGTRVVAVIPRQ